MYKATIRRYVDENKFIEIQVPQRVTITGREDHFARACEDVDMAVAGMRAMDRALGLGEHPEVIYDVIEIIRTDIARR